jgi:hypothetical protein
VVTAVLLGSLVMLVMACLVEETLVMEIAAIPVVMVVQLHLS